MFIIIVTEIITIVIIKCPIITVRIFFVSKGTLKLDKCMGPVEIIINNISDGS